MRIRRLMRFQLSLNVADVDASVEHYSRLLGIAPAKHRPGYANFAVADPPMKLVLIEGEGAPGTINHMGSEVDSVEAVRADMARLEAQGLPTRTDPVHICCHAVQDKGWTIDPDDVPWEIYTVLDDTDDFGEAHGAGHDEAASTPLVEDPTTAVSTVGTSELAAMVEQGTVRLVDAQAPGWFEREHIPGAVAIDWDDLEASLAARLPDRTESIVVYCWNETCSASAAVADQLVTAGYQHVRRYPGGKQAWHDAGFPLDASR